MHNKIQSQLVSEELSLLLGIQGGYRVNETIKDATNSKIFENGTSLLGIYNNRFHENDLYLKQKRIKLYLDWAVDYEETLMNAGYLDREFLHEALYRYLYSRMVPERLKSLFDAYHKNSAIIQLSKRLNKDMQKFLNTCTNIKISMSKKSIKFSNRDELNLFLLMFDNGKYDIDTIFMEDYAKPIDIMIEKYFTERSKTK